MHFLSQTGQIKILFPLLVLVECLMFFQYFNLHPQNSVVAGIIKRGSTQLQSALHFILLIRLL